MGKGGRLAITIVVLALAAVGIVFSVEAVL